MRKDLLVRIISGLENLLQIPLFLVGGAVRNFLLETTIEDFDFATPALPEQIEESIKKIGKKPYLLGKRFGTVGLKLDLRQFFTDQTLLEQINSQQFSVEQCLSGLCFDNQQLIEITTFRQEIYQQGSRKPQVTFASDLACDLSRRDFTINAIAIDSRGQIIDLFEGQKDLQAKILRAVGIPKQRFLEDPLRILRAVRFAGRLGFVLEQQTLNDILETRFALLKVSKERWVMELDKILQIPSPTYTLDLLAETKVLQVILPELNLQIEPNSNNSWWVQTKKLVTDIPANDLDGRWTALLTNLARPFYQEVDLPNYRLLNAEFSLKISHYLKFSNSRTQYIYQHLQTGI